MKKFKFPLDTVLNYKQQVLDALRGEHGAILAKVHEQEEILDAVWERYHSCNDEYRERKLTGLTISEATFYQTGLRALEIEIQRETDRLKELKKLEEKKREEMVEAKKETASLEKLREKKLEQYQKAVQKGEEALIEEFVSTTRLISTSA